MKELASRPATSPRLRGEVGISASARGFRVRGNGALVLAEFCAIVKRPLTPPLSPQAGRGRTLRLGSGKRPISSHALRRPRSGRLEGRTTPIQAIVDFLTPSKAGIQICLGTGPLFAARGRLRRCDEGASFGCSVFPHQHALGLRLSLARRCAGRKFE